MDAARRPITSRSNPLIQRLAAWLARRGVSPNQVSVSSVIFALIGAWGLNWLPLHRQNEQAIGSQRLLSCSFFTNYSLR